MSIDYSGFLTESFSKHFTEEKLAKKFNKNSSGKHPASEITKKAIRGAQKRVGKDNIQKFIDFSLDVKQSCSIQIGNVLETFINEILDECERKRNSKIKNLQNTLDDGKIKTENGSKQIDAIWFDYKNNVVNYREIKTTTNYDTEKKPKIQKKVGLVKKHLDEFDFNENISVSEVKAGGLTPTFYEDPKHKNSNGFYNGLKSFLEEVRIKDDINMDNLITCLTKNLEDYIVRQYNKIK